VSKVWWTTEFSSKKESLFLEGPSDSRDKATRGDIDRMVLNTGQTEVMAE
jgi:hypothetical protein